VFAGVLVAVIAAAAILAVAGWFAYAEIATQAGRYRDYKSLQENAGKADSLAAAYGALQADLRALRSALPDRNQGSQVLNSLVEDARRYNLAIGGINALDEVPFPGYRELPFEVEASGGFKDLVGYIRALETRGMALQVRRFTAQAESMNKARVKAKLELSVFVPDEPGAPGDAGAAP
jgi:Tfp pilus assembly protein PilO